MEDLKSPKKSINPMAWFIGAIIIVGLGWLLWQAFQKDDTSTQQQQTTSSSATETSLTPQSTEIKSIDEILTLTAQQDATAIFAGVEFATEDGVDVYKVTTKTGLVYIFDANTGELIKQEQSTETREGEIPTDFSTNITFEQAIAIAQAKFPNSQVEKVELENEHGALIFSVRFTDESRVDINAITGEITRTKNQGEDEIKIGDDDFDDDGIKNSDDSDDDNDGQDDSVDSDDDNDGISDDQDGNDDNDGLDNDEDDDDDEDDNSGSGNDDEEDDSDNSGHGNSNDN